MGKVLVFVLDTDDTSRGEISVVDRPEEAQSLIEKLLDAGYPVDRFLVFDGNQIKPVVTYQPIVSLMGNGSGPSADPMTDLPD